VGVARLVHEGGVVRVARDRVGVGVRVGRIGLRVGGAGLIDLGGGGLVDEEEILRGEVRAGVLAAGGIRGDAGAIGVTGDVGGTAGDHVAVDALGGDGRDLVGTLAGRVGVADQLAVLVDLAGFGGAGLQFVDDVALDDGRRHLLGGRTAGVVDEDRILVVEVRVFGVDGLQGLVDVV